MAVARLRVVVVGRGKLGRAWLGALRAAGVEVRSRAGRSVRGECLPDADLVILAVRDDAVATVAEVLAATLGSTRPCRAAVVHCAGRLGPEALAALGARGVGVAKMHPLLAVADGRRAPPFAGAWLHVVGDARACRVAARLARRLGMRVWRAAEVDHVLYHAAAALLANGAAALGAVAADLLAAACGGAVTAGGARTFARMLGALLGSVAHNLTQVGLPGALTGPVRRGDAAAVRAHLAVLDDVAPDAATLLRALVGAQLPLARALGAPAVGLEAIADALRHGGASPSAASRRARAVGPFARVKRPRLR
ncbi:MAG: DUF2520 domain-containing protein [Polyangiaceae bacterium]|nr:DUF2520 domain-containing protein [Polyangiaceae bacterium]